jgi:hypothetical protein
MMLHQLTLGDMQELNAREIDYDTDLKHLMHSRVKPLVRLADPKTNHGGGWFCQPMKHCPTAPKTVKIIRVFVGDSKVRHDNEWDQKVTNTTCDLNLPWKDGIDEYKGAAQLGQSVSIYFCFGASNPRDWRNFYFGDMKIQAITDHEKVCKVHFVTPDQYVDVQGLKRRNNHLECTNERLKRARKSETKFLRNRSASMENKYASAIQELQSKLELLDECKTQISKLKQNIHDSETEKKRLQYCHEQKKEKCNDDIIKEKDEEIRKIRKRLVNQMLQENALKNELKLQENALKKHEYEFNEYKKKWRMDEIKKLLKPVLNKPYGQRILTAFDAHQYI